jgi:hypothetical protein
MFTFMQYVHTCPFSIFVQLFMPHGHAARKAARKAARMCSTDIQHGHTTWTFSMFMQNGYAAWASSMDIMETWKDTQHRHGHAASPCSMAIEMQH